MADHYIPIRRTELIDLLCAAPDLPADDGNRFRHFCERIGATCYFEYVRLLERLKASYAAFDPDCDTKALGRLRSEEKQQKLNGLIADFAWLMERANYKHMCREDLEPMVGARSQWGLLVDVDFRMFERLAIFSRGDTIERRPLRRMRRMFRTEEVDVPVYQRLVMIMKLRKHPRLGRWVDTNKVYLQIFKNIPKLDINMLLPGARVRMTRIDRGKIGFPMISGLGMAMYNVASDFAEVLMRTFTQPSLILWGLATGAVSYGTKSWFSYLSLRQRYNLNLTQVLYFQNLDTNAGVLFRLMDEAQEQECREVCLSYYCLWRHTGAEGLTGAELAAAIDRRVHELADLELHVDIERACARLARLGLIEMSGDRYRAVPIPQTVALLDAHWAAYFHTTTAKDNWSVILRPKEEALDYCV